ncbi:MAG TPA: glutathione synthetase [Longimicrobiaceae bacterium]|nr:glutathione synthetase [Longimicrobiaceae bacterium]
MRIGFVVNDVNTEIMTAATINMARAATAMDHTVYMIGVGDLTYLPDGSVGAIAIRTEPSAAGSPESFMAFITDASTERKRITSADLDVLYLRYNPGENEGSKPWEQDAGIVFGQIAMLEGVIVLNHPYTLAYAVNKMYFQHFPEAIRPRTLITRNVDEIRSFYEEQDGGIVLKPLRGYGGADVYLLKEDATNLKQIVESIGRSSYIIVQEYLPAATEGDTRLFLMNGKPLQCDGKYAALRRVNSGGDFRSNISAGGKPARAEITDEILELADLVRPRLLADGLFFVGIDIVGNKLVEINTISAGGLNAAGKLEGVSFGEEVVMAIERKVRHRDNYGGRLRNRQLAVME